MKRASRLSALAVIASLTFGGLTAPNAFAANLGDPANNAQNAPAAPANDELKEAKAAATKTADEAISLADEAVAAAAKKDTAAAKEHVDKANAAKKAAQEAKPKIEAAKTADEVKTQQAAADKAKTEAQAAKDAIAKLADKKTDTDKDIAAAKDAANKAVDDAIKVTDEALAAAKKKEQTDSLKAAVKELETLKTNLGALKKEISETKTVAALNAQKDKAEKAKATAVEQKQIIDKVADKKGSSNISSENKNVRTALAVVLGVLGVGALVAAIFQFAGPALKNLGIELPKF